MLRCPALVLRWPAVLLLTIWTGSHLPPSAAAAAAADSCPSPCKCNADLTTVTCSDALLTSVPPDIPTAVRRLNLDKNHITEIVKDALTGLTNLQWLSIKNNYLITIDARAFVDQGNLKDLFFTGNQLEVEDLGGDVLLGLESLQHLYLEQNQLTGIPNAHHLSSLLSLSMDFNQVDNATFPLGYVNVSLQSITLSNNKIVSLSKQNFANLKRAAVTKLTLSRNQISEVAEGTFDGFTKLQSLDVSYNDAGTRSPEVLKAILGSLKDAPLFKLDLDGFVMSQLPADTFDPMTNVTTLKVLSIAHSDKWTVKNGTFKALGSLDHLDLSYNHFDVFDDGAFTGLDNLQTLHLENNKLEDIPAGLPRSVRYLDLSHNNLATLPSKRFISMSELTNLTLSHGSIHEIKGDSLLGLSALVSLDLSFNQIGSSSIPNELFKPLINLLTLNLTRNNMAEIKTQSKLFSPLTALVELGMADNNCRHLPTGIFDGLTALTKLDLHGNYLGKIVAADSIGHLFRNLTSLVDLDLSRGDIADLPALTFQHLSSLSKLDLGRNELSVWDQGLFSGIPNARLVDMSNNKISVINETSLLGLAPDTKLNLEGNPFACWCDLTWFRDWMDAHNTTLTKVDQYMCNSPDEYANKPLLSFRPEAIRRDCIRPPYVKISVAAVAAGVGLIFIVTSLVYRHRWSIRRRLYLFKRRRYRKNGGRRNGAYQPIDGENTLYDVSILYHGSNVDWIKDQLVKRISDEEGDNFSADDPEADVGDQRRRFKVYFEDGYVSGNQNSLWEIGEAIFKSERTIVVISDDYLKDHKCIQYELPLVLVNTYERQFDVADGVLVVLLDDVAEKLPKSLWMVRDRLMRWPEDHKAGQDLFWNELHDRLEELPVPRKPEDV